MTSKKKTVAPKKASAKKKTVQKAPAKAKQVKTVGVKKPTKVKPTPKAKPKAKPSLRKKTKKPVELKLTKKQWDDQAKLQKALDARPIARPWIDRCSYIIAQQKAGSKAHKRLGVVGRPATYDCSYTLWEMCCEYFQYTADHPLWETKVAQYQGTAVDMIVPKMAAMTLVGLQMYVGINKQSWLDYQSRGDGFPEVCAAAEHMIYQQKFQGAAADQLNPAIIARDLGLADKKEVGVSEDNPLTALINSLSGNTIGPKQ